MMMKGIIQFTHAPAPGRIKGPAGPAHLLDCCSKTWGRAASFGCSLGRLGRWSRGGGTRTERRLMLYLRKLEWHGIGWLVLVSARKSL